MGESCGDTRDNWGTTDGICRLHPSGTVDMLGRSDIWFSVSNSAPTIPPELRGRTAQEFTTALTKRIASVIFRFTVQQIAVVKFTLFALAQLCGSCSF